MRTFQSIALALILLVFAPMRAYAQISDRELFDKIADLINNYPQYGMFDSIEVAVDNRAVTLGGWVTMPVKKDDIVKRVRKVDGIRTLTDAINVLPVSPSDDALRNRVAYAIYQHPAFWMQAQMPVPPIHIIVEHGRITLTGVADSVAQRTLASSLAEVGGNFGVTNRIQVPPQPVRRAKTR
jgi:hyperosmotically inducible protein